MSEDLETVADLAMGEIKRRFEDAPRDIPDHVLAKYFTDINKTIDRRAEAVEEDTQPFSLLDELDTLPRHRAHALAELERDRFLAEARALDDWMEANPVAGTEQEAAEVSLP